MILRSPVIDEGKPIPVRYTADGENVSPPLQWRDPPENTEEFALIVDDPDAPREEPWVHWVMYRIPKIARELPEDIPPQTDLTQPEGATQGLNSWRTRNLGYRGPAPPKGHGRHRYHFRLFALDTTLELESRADKQAVLNAIEGHVLAEAEFVGTYERP